jgi:hypothetical protein
MELREMSEQTSILSRRQLLVAISGSALFAGRATGATPLTGEPGALLNAHRKMFASLEEEDVCCWYLGTMFIRPDGLPEIPVLHSTTIMVYRTDNRVSAGYRMRWTEVGCFRDAVTGGPAGTWLNPLTGETAPTPRTFRDGPGEYLVRADGETLAVDLNQTGAIVDGVDVSLTQDGSRTFLNQTERKRRQLSTGTTVADADLPSAVTTLSLWADSAEIADPARPSAHASGTYSFESEGLPGFGGLDGIKGTTIIRGVIKKAATDEVVNPAAWERLKSTYPDFFDANGVAPQWKS